MIRECPVMLNNEAVTVVRYGDILIQFSAQGKGIKKVYVDYQDGRYRITDKPAPEVKSKEKKNNNIKKTTVKEQSENIEKAD